MKHFARTNIGFVIRIGKLRVHIWREPKKRKLIEIVQPVTPAETPANPT
jgi:hypothetical protein